MMVNTVFMFSFCVYLCLFKLFMEMESPENSIHWARVGQSELPKYKTYMYTVQGGWKINTHKLYCIVVYVNIELRQVSNTRIKYS